MGVQNSDWGPHLWRILHVMAERLGRQSVALLATDEARAWILFLRNTESVMPCAMCRGHYRTWRKEHPLEVFQHMRGEQLRSAARDWLWQLHEQVNDRRGIVSDARVPLEILEDRYGGTPAIEAARKGVEALGLIWKEAMVLGLVNGADVRTWRQHFSLLRSLVGF